MTEVMVQRARKVATYTCLGLGGSVMILATAVVVFVKTGALEGPASAPPGVLAWAFAPPAAISGIASLLSLRLLRVPLPRKSVLAEQAGLDGRDALGPAGRVVSSLCFASIVAFGLAMLPALLGVIAFTLTGEVPFAAGLVVESLCLAVVCFPRPKAWERALESASAEDV